MTLREKIIELMRFHYVNEWTKKDEHPTIDVYIPLKHDRCFGNDVINIYINDGFPKVLNTNFPSVYGDIYDQEVVGEDKNKQEDGRYIRIHLDIDPEYLEAKAKELNDSLPNKDVLIPQLTDKVWAKVHSSRVYEQATPEEAAYIDQYMTNVLAKDDLYQGTKKDIMGTFDSLLRALSLAMEALHDKFLKLGKTNYELMQKMDFEQLANFLAYDLPKDIKDDYHMKQYLKQVHD